MLRYDAEKPKCWKMCERPGILSERRDFDDERGGRRMVVKGNWQREKEKNDQ